MNLLNQLQTVTFHRAFVDIGGSINAALLLSNAIYWTNRLPPERDGWFYKTRVDWEKETGLTRREQDKARQQLIENGLLEVRRSKVSEDECVTALWFRVNLDALQARLTGDDQRAESANCQMAESANTKRRKAPIGLLIEKRTSTTTSTPPPPRPRAILPCDWLPTDSVYPVLLAESIPLEFAVNCLPEFRLYWNQRQEPRPDWDSVFIRQVRNEFAYQQQQETRRHERSDLRQSVSGQSPSQSRRPRKETLAERCARYDRFAAGLDLEPVSETAYDAIPGEFIRH